MGEKGNVADVRSAGGHVASATQAVAPAQGAGMGAPSPAQGDDGGLLSDLADIAKDTASDIGGQSRGGATGIVGGRDDEDEDEDER